MKIEQPSPLWTFETDTIERWTYWENAFSAEECDQIIKIGKEYKSYSAPVNNDTGEIRKSNVVFLYPQETTVWIYKRLTQIIESLNNSYFKFDVFGLTEALQFTEYKAPDGHYAYHTDRVPHGVIRKLSFVIQLTDDTEYEGGDFEILDGTLPEKLPRTRGTLLLFPSFTLHKVNPVTKGLRNSLVGWVSGKKFV